MCLQKGWVKKEHFDLIERSETVCQTLCDLVEYAAHADLTERFIQELIDFGRDTVKASWLLELMRAREDVYRPPQNRRLDLASADHALLLAAYKLTQTSTEIRDCSPTYW